MIEPGIYYNMPQKEYRADPAVNQSTLKEIARSAAHAKEKIDNPPEPSKFMNAGSGYHIYTMFGEQRFHEECAVQAPNKSMTEAWKKSIGDKIPLPWDSSDHQGFIDIRGMSLATQAHPVAGPMINRGEREVSGFYIDPDLEVRCKLRPDIWIVRIGDSDDILIDLKKTKDARKRQFTNQAHSLGYHIQAGAYTYGMTRILGREVSQFIFIATEIAPPYGIKLYLASPEFLQEGLIEYQRLLAIYSECMQTGVWPNYPPEIDVLELPGYARRKKAMAPLYEI